MIAAGKLSGENEVAAIVLIKLSTSQRYRYSTRRGYTLLRSSSDGGRSVCEKGAKCFQCFENRVCLCMARSRSRMCCAASEESENTHRKPERYQGKVLEQCTQRAFARS